MEELLYKDLTEKIRQASCNVHNYFGNGFLEKVYENALAFELRQQDIKCEQQVALTVYYKNNIVVGGYFADIIVDHKIIIELKVTGNIDKIYYAQVKNYLKATKYRLGLLINFGKSRLEFKRIIL